MHDLTSDQPKYKALRIGDDWAVVHSCNLAEVVRIPGVTGGFANVIAQRLCRAASRGPLTIGTVDDAACGAWWDFKGVYGVPPVNFADYKEWSYTVQHYLETVDG